MDLDHSLEDLTWDNVESVQLVSVRNSGLFNGTIARVLRLPLTLREQYSSGGAYQAGDVVFLLPARLLPSALGSPKPADQVIDNAGTVFTVIGPVEGQGRDSFQRYTVYRLTTRDLAIAFDLRDVCDLQRAGLSEDAAGGVVRHWPDHNAPGVDAGGTTLAAGISCRAQLEDKQEADERGVRGLRERYTVILDRQVVLAREDRLKVTQAAGPVLYLDVVRLYDISQLGELPKVECVRAV